VSQPLRVLIIEDQKDDVALVLRELKHTGFQPDYVTLDTPEELRSALGTGRFDVVLSDFNMPRMNALDALRIVREATGPVPFLIVSGSIGEELAVECIRAGVDDYLMKENLTRLGPAIRRALEDAEERRRRLAAEAALQESEERMRVVAETASDAFITIDEESTIVFVNPAAERIFGYSSGEMLGNRLTMLMPDHLSPVHVESLARYLTTGRRNISWQAVELPGRHRSGRPISLELSFAETAKGGRRYFTGICRDVTDRKRTEEALRQREEELRQAQKMEAIGRLSGGVAHDFNNLLTVITGYTEILLDRLDQNDSLRQNVEEIGKAGERAATLTRQLLAFSRRQVLQPRTLNLNAIVTGTEEMLRRLIGEDIELVTSLEPKLGSVRADSGQIEQVIMNLVVNARDSMPRGGKVTIETANAKLDEPSSAWDSELMPGAHVALLVRDTGAGMSAETRSQIFEPFFTTKETGKGTGLGLSTVYGIVRQSGGAIRVQSEVGRGSTFTAYFPAVSEGTTPETPRGPGHDARPGGGETILLVEDDEGVRRLVHDALVARGYDVLTAREGEEAVERAQADASRKIDLLLTDVVMPRMSGIEVGERIRAARPGLKVLFMSGYTDRAVVTQQIFRRGFSLLPKPFTMEKLMQRVREVLAETGEQVG
jgi:hypothetical protein